MIDYFLLGLLRLALLRVHHFDKGGRVIFPASEADKRLCQLPQHGGGVVLIQHIPAVIFHHGDQGRDGSIAVLLQ